MLRRAAAGLVLLLLPACSNGAGAQPGSASPTASPTPSPSPSATSSPTLALQQLGGFASPVWVGAAPGDSAHLYLAQRGGAVLRLDAQGKREGVLLDLGDRISSGNERGLLSIAFDPAYPRVPQLYVDYTDTQGAITVASYTVVRGQAVEPRLLLRVPKPYANNNGGMLLFDRAGMLLVGTGDGGNAGDPQNRAQDLGSLLGKILRIDPRTGRAAPGNPYPAAPLVWALGLRNPSRASLDTNGDLYLGDAGQRHQEEIDVVPPALQRGANYGWAVYEGDERFKKDQQFTPGGPVIAPALTYLHSDGGCSVVAGSVYRGRALPWLRGSFVYGDYCAGRLMAATRTARGLTPAVKLNLRSEGLQAFGVDPRGELLVLTVDRLSRLVPGA